MGKGICVLSGGLDSCCLAYMMKNMKDIDSLEMINFNYGQRHKKEIDYAKKIADKLESKIHLVDLTQLTPLLKGSALTDDIKVPEIEYDEKSMSLTVVPNRNAIMLSIAWGYATSIKASIIGCGAHAGDHFIYPDCRHTFFDLFERTMMLGTQGISNPELNLFLPFLQKDKSYAVKVGKQLGVDFTQTWSCYKGGDIHCGKCGTCYERKKAFLEAGINDPTQYEV